MDLPRRVREQLEAHATNSVPHECCGILVGSKSAVAGSRVEYALEVENSSSSLRARRFAISPLAVLEAQSEARSAGFEILGYYHSHPSGSATPSTLDRVNAWPETSYVILGVEGGVVRQLRSWRLGPGETGFVEQIVTCEDKPQ